MSDDTTGIVYQQAKLLNRYYEKVGRAAAGMGQCPHFVEFRAGFGLVDETDLNHPLLLPIPPNMSAVPNEFYRGPCEPTYANGVTLCKCEMPAGTVGEPKRYNLIGIFDQDSELVAVCVTLPDWITPAEIERAYPALTFPIENEESANA